MAIDNFFQRKKDILSKLDKSAKKSWDKKILNLCNKINKSNNYYTTSSCSGRIVLMIDSEKKGEGLFIWVSHDLINLKELNEVLEEIKLHSQVREINKNQLNKKNKLKKLDLINFKSIPRRGQLIKFKQEPCILHVACKNLEAAQKLLNKAKSAGWKKSGIIASGKRFFCEFNSTEKLEFLIMNKSKILVNKDFFKLTIKKSNENLKKSWMKIKRLEKVF